jgi:tRNA pseudouridine38-40 synthase
VQGELDGAVHAIAPHASLTRGSSRTDAGVHALSHPVAFDTNMNIPPRGWALALARELPEEISVVGASRVPVGFEPRHSARRKIYRYALLESETRDPLLVGRAWRVGNRLNQQAMSEAAQLLIGEHDFAGFRGSQDERVHTVRRLFRVEVRTARSNPRITEIEVEGDGFLYKMVRIIVGTLVEIGRGRLTGEVFTRALESRSRPDLGITAPPDGLYLVNVELDGDVTETWPNDTPH